MAKTKREQKENATTMAGKIREISISEFFSKNRHLLGFDNPTKALLTAIREGVDNALDACEEAHILPDVEVKIEAISDSRFKVSIEDNGPGILKSHLPNIFGKLLYGSKFHRLKQSRGQQGIGISAAVMYGQMTTGKSAEVISKTGRGKLAHRIKLQIDTKKNAPKVISDSVINDSHWEQKDSGTCIKIELEGAYKETRHGGLSYMRQSALSNPHANLTYVDPKKKIHRFPRLIHTLPVQPKDIKPHPHGIELGTLIQFLHDARGKTVGKFLKDEFCRVSESAAREICKTAKIYPGMRATTAGRTEAECLYEAIKTTKLLAPSTNCLSPMGEESILKALYWLFIESKKFQNESEDSGKIESSDSPKTKGKGQGEFLFDENASDDGAANPVKRVNSLQSDQEGSLLSEEEGYFVSAVTRPPSVYRGNPFQVEVGIFYGRNLKADNLAQVYRYANRVPLQYQASACAIQKSVISAPWKSYGLQQSRGALPTGPVVIMVHIASAWVPYTSESKEAIAHYPEILKEFRLALMECGRRLQRFLKRRRKQADEAKKRSYIEKYLDPIGEALQDILGFSKKEKEVTVENLEHILEKTREKHSVALSKKSAPR